MSPEKLEMVQRGFRAFNDRDLDALMANNYYGPNDALEAVGLGE